MIEANDYLPRFYLFRHHVTVTFLLQLPEPLLFTARRVPKEPGFRASDVSVLAGLPTSGSRILFIRFVPAYPND